jgi:lambda family phage minor tail protein L
MSIPATEFLTLTPDAPIDLYVLDLNSLGVDQVYRFCNWRTADGADIVFQSNTYTSIPLEATGFERNARGQSASPQIKFGNVFGAITAFAIAYDDLVGAKLIRKRTLAKFLDGMPQADSSRENIPDPYIVYRKVSENEVEITFELRRSLDIGFRTKLPARVILKNLCPWQYRGDGCGYTGGPVADTNDNAVNFLAEDKCGKRLSSCRLRFGQYGQLPFGAFPGVDNARL